MLDILLNIPSHLSPCITRAQVEFGSMLYLVAIFYFDMMVVGVGLMEIITEPDFSSSNEAVSFVKELQLILQTLGTCDGRMEGEGSSLLKIDYFILFSFSFIVILNLHPNLESSMLAISQSVSLSECLSSRAASR